MKLDSTPTAVYVVQEGGSKELVPCSTKPGEGKDFCRAKPFNAFAFLEHKLTWRCSRQSTNILHWIICRSSGAYLRSNISLLMLSYYTWEKSFQSTPLKLTCHHLCLGLELEMTGPLRCGILPPQNLGPHVRWCPPLWFLAGDLQNPRSNLLLFSPQVGVLLNKLPAFQS